MSPTISSRCVFISSTAVDLAAYREKDPLPTRWGYAVFGRVIEGMEVVDRISVSPTGPAGPFKSDAPLQQVVIQKIEMLAPSADSPATAPATAPTTTPAPPPPPMPAPQPGATPPAPNESGSQPTNAPASAPPPGAPPPK